MNTETTQTNNEDNQSQVRSSSRYTQWNWIQLSGRLATDVRERKVNEQVVIGSTLMFETLRKTDKEGSHVNFVEIELWGKMAELFAPLLKKGTEILVSGELFQRRWESKEQRKAEKYCVNVQALAITDQAFRPN